MQSAVRGGGVEGGGVNPVSKAPIEQEHPGLDTDGGNQHHRRDPGEFHRRRVENLVQGGLGQLEADEDNQHAHRQAA